MIRYEKTLSARDKRSKRKKSLIFSNGSHQSTINLRMMTFSRKSIQAGTCQWFLNSPRYKNWIEKEKDILYCPRIPGAGKTILAATTIEDLTLRYQNNRNIAIAYIYCNFRRTEEQKAEDLCVFARKHVATVGICPKKIRSNGCY